MSPAQILFLVGAKTGTRLFLLGSAWSWWQRPAGWGVVRYQRAERCRSARAAFVGRVGELTREVQRQLVPGAKKDAVARFFADQGIALEIQPMGDRQVASGELKIPAPAECVASGCAAGRPDSGAGGCRRCGDCPDQPFVVATGTNRLSK